MRPREEHALAARLAAVLEGEAGEGEERLLALLLERAAAPARLELAPDEVERALARIRPGIRRAPRRRIAYGAVALAGIAAAALLVLPLLRTAGLNVEGKARAALARPGAFRIVETVISSVPGAAEESTRTGWFDPVGGRVRWTQTVDGRPAGITLIEPGRFARYLPDSDTIVVGTSCHAFAAGCSELVDPLELYRHELRRGAVSHTDETSFGGRKAYELVLPLTARFDQIVTVDARTFLPVEIDWREHGRIVATIAVELARTQPPADAFRLPAAAHTVHVAEPSAIVSTRHLTLAEARRVVPALVWSGPTYHGAPLTAIVELRYAHGRAYRFDYDGISVWNYDRVVPLELAAAHLDQAKTVPSAAGLVHLYATETAEFAAVIERGERSVAITSVLLSKGGFFAGLSELRPMRR